MAPSSSLRNYLMVTAGYWAFTVTDGAIRNEWGYVNRLMDLATVVARSIQSEV